MSPREEDESLLYLGDFYHGDIKEAKVEPKQTTIESDEFALYLTKSFQETLPNKPLESSDEDVTKAFAYLAKTSKEEVSQPVAPKDIKDSDLVDFFSL
jgi:hypothetical protein